MFSCTSGVSRFLAFASPLPFFDHTLKIMVFWLPACSPFWTQTTSKMSCLLIHFLRRSGHFPLQLQTAALPLLLHDMSWISTDTLHDTSCYHMSVLTWALKNSSPTWVPWHTLHSSSTAIIQQALTSCPSSHASTSSWWSRTPFSVLPKQKSIIPLATSTSYL